MHESPKVLSFIERLNTKVLRENEDLKNKMAELLDIAKNNQQLQDNIEILEQRLLKCRSVKDLVRTLERELKKRFRVEYVTFGLAADTSDAFFKERNRLSKGFQSTSPVFLETELLQNYFPGASAAPVLDSVGSVPVSPFFDAKASAEIRSVALVPLFIGGRIAGSLNMGSPDPRRYSPDKGTDFLVRLGNKISLAADNVLTHHRLLEAERTDPVTGLPNYSFFREVLRSEFGAFKEGGMPAACAIMGVDGLYALNDRFGPRAGNDALVHAAGVLKELTRKQDLSAHYGWDSIAAFFPNTSEAVAVRIAGKYARRLSQRPLRIRERTVGLGLSVGMSCIPEDAADDADAFIAQAEARLIRARENGGGKIISK